MVADKVFAARGDPLWVPFNVHIDSFLTHLRTEGYASRTLKKKRTIANSFARWSVEKQISVAELNEVHLTAFVERRPMMRKDRVKAELATLRLFLKYLRTEFGIPITPLQIYASPADSLKQRYMDYLRKDRGLTDNTIRVYMPFIHDFLSEQSAKTGGVSPEVLDAIMVRDFLLDQVNSRSRENFRLLATVLRSFFRFLYLCGETEIDLSFSVPTVRRWREAEVHSYLSPEEVERVLSTTDRSIPSGRRDYAILLLLARLGLRAGEVVALKLCDIHWRTGEIIVRGKGRVLDHLPLLSDIGDALAFYLSKDRGASSSRHVFLRIFAPRVGLAGPAAVGHIVRRAFRRAGVEPPSHCAAHLFRHSLATKMIRCGASIAEISEILRHRSQSSTAIYAKVDFEALRGVARSWPGKGGER